MFCDNSSVLNIIYYVKTLLKILAIAVPILMILLTSLDILKAVSNGEEMEAHLNTAVNRIFVGAVFFFIPTIVGLFLGIMDNSVDTGRDSFISCYESASAENIKFLAAKEEQLKQAEKIQKKLALEKQEMYRKSFTASRKEIEKQRASEIKRLEKERQERLKKENEMGEERPDSSSHQDEDGGLDDDIIGETVDGTAKSYKDIVWDPKDVTKISNIKSSQLTKLLKSYDGKLGKLVPYVDGLITIEHKYKVNIFFLMGIQIHESGWYKSKLARNCNNFGGIKKTSDSAVCNVMPSFRYYPTPTHFFDHQARLLSKNYLKPSGPYYKGKSIYAVNRTYCPLWDGGCNVWTSSITNISNGLFNKLKGVI